LSHLFSFLLCLFITSFLSLQRGSVVSPTTSNSSLTRGVNGVRNLFKRSSTIDNENTLNENNINTTPDKTTHTNTTTYTPSKSMFDMSTIFENRSNSPTRNSPLTGINSAFVANTTMNNTTNPSYSPGMKRRNSSPVPFVTHEESDLNGIGISLGRGNSDCYCQICVFFFNNLSSYCTPRIRRFTTAVAEFVVLSLTFIPLLLFVYPLTSWHTNPSAPTFRLYHDSSWRRQTHKLS